MARQLRVVSIVSPSSDGDMLARILASNNVGAVRGSSTRGGVRALLSLARMMKHEQVHACITVDGPAGPRHKSKEGPLFLANRTNARIISQAISMRTAKKKKKDGDEKEAPNPMSGMMKFMPFTTLIFGFMVPAGLALYWAIGNILSILQTYLIRSVFSKKKEGSVKNA